MRFGKRRKETDAPEDPAAAAVPASAAPPAGESWSAAPAEQRDEAQAREERVAYEEPVVEGEAVELPFPVADQPVGVVTPGAAEAPVTSLGESAEAFASGHAAGSAPSWQEPVMELADERPELVVGAAFAGGVLAAMILRRLAS